MTVSLKHQFVSNVADSPDATLVQPSNWNAEHTLTANADSLLGAVTAGNVVEVTCTSAGRALLDDADASAQRTTLGLGSIATLSAPTGNVVGTTDTQTLTNKRVTPRVLASTANSATPTINTDDYDIVVITAQTNNITSMTTNLSGTPTNGQKLWISFTASSGTPSITWGGSFESSTATLPASMTTSRSDVGFVWNVATTKWRCVAVA